MLQKDSLANSVDLMSSLICLPRPVCLKTKDHYSRDRHQITGRLAVSNHLDFGMFKVNQHLRKSLILGLVVKHYRVVLTANRILKK